MPSFYIPLDISKSLRLLRVSSFIGSSFFNYPYYPYVLIYFLKTNTVSGYLMTPVVKEALYDYYFYACPPNPIKLHTLQYIIHFTHTSPTYAWTSLQKSLPKNYAPTSVWSYINIESFSCIPLITNSITHYLSRLNQRVQKVSLMEHASIRTNVLASLFPFPSKRVKKIWINTHSSVAI